MPGRQDAEFAGCPGGLGSFAAKCAGATGDVARQRVVSRRLVVLGVVMVAPQSRRHAIPQLGTVLKASMGRTVEGLKDLQGLQCGHDRFSPTPCILLRRSAYASLPADKIGRASCRERVCQNV